MAPKGKTSDKGAVAKGKGKGKAEEKEEKGGKVKPSQTINVRHILVGARLELEILAAIDLSFSVRETWEEGASS